MKRILSKNFALMSNVSFKKVTSATRNQLLAEPMKFDVVLECTKELADDLEFDVIYSGDARCEDYDQKICSMLVGPVPLGKIGFTLETDPVDVGLINPKQIFGVTSAIIVGRYRSQQFLRIGYVINVSYPGIPDNELVDYEEELYEEDLGSTEDDEDAEEGDTDAISESSDALGEEQGQRVQEKEGGHEDREGLSEAKESASNPSSHPHHLRTKEESLKSTKYKEMPEELKEELEEEVHESSFSDVKAKLDEDVYCEVEENKIVVNGIALDKTKIEIEFMEPPVTTIFEIDWEQEHTIEEESDEHAKRVKAANAV